MSLGAFQSVLARLVVEPHARGRARMANQIRMAPGLSSRERRRLRRIVTDPGLEVTATLIKSFRLGKILSLLPLTRILIGNRRVAREATRFWKTHPPTTLYPLEEALEFCDYLLTRSRGGLRSIAYLGDVVAYERAMLELRRIRTDGPPPPQVLRFHHDPGRLLRGLAAGRRPRSVRAVSLVMSASLAEDGTVHWAPGPVEQRRTPRRQSRPTSQGRVAEDSC